MLSSLLLPDTKEMHLLEEICLETGNLVLKVMATQKSYCCPECNFNSARVHSQYQRKLADLPCVGIPVRVVWTVRRFFCDNRECNRVTFAEQIPNVAARYARRTCRLHQQQTDIGFIVGGEPGAKLAHRLEIPTSADTLLGMVRNAPEQEAQIPTILGVDDWAIRKGKSYGTIMIDLETRRPVDLLNERSTEALAKWLQAHPGVKIISRDRSNEYAKGATIGAPDAIQVADRFHLVKNLREALELFLEENRHCLRAAGEISTQNQSPTAQHVALSETEPIQLHHQEQSPTQAAKKRHIIRQKRLEKYEKVKELHLQGEKVRAIARQLGLHRSTVRKYVRAGEFPEMAQRCKMPVKLDPYLSYLEERWQSGCRNRLQLWREICERGFDGTHQLVYAWSKQKDFSKKGTLTLPEAQTSKTAAQPAKTRPWAAKRASWLLVLDQHKLNQENKAAYERMVQAEPLIDTARKLAQEFLHMIRNRQAETLLDWLKRARECGIEALKSFVNGLENDLGAVRAALSLPWSNGPTEGNVNRLKLIKRQMYGRANFDLLRRRVLGLPAPP
jgi:transposase